MTTIKLHNKEFDLNNSQQRLEYSEQFAIDKLLGKTVKTFGSISPSEIRKIGWKIKQQTTCFEFTDGTIIFPVQDLESQEAGVFKMYDAPKNAELKGGIVLEVGFLSIRNSNKMGFKRRPIFLLIRIKTGEKILVISQTNTSKNEACPVIGTHIRDNWALSPIKIKNS